MESFNTFSSDLTITLHNLVSMVMDCRSDMWILRGERWKMVHVFEKFFYWWGCTVAANPWKIILATLFVTGLASLGLLNFKSETDGWKLWLPEGSHHSVITNWKKEHFMDDIRGTITLFNHVENVLTKEALLLLLDLHERVQSVQFEGGNFTKACLKIPITNILLASKRKKRDISGTNDTAPIKLTEVTHDYDEYFNFYGEEVIEENDEVIVFMISFSIYLHLGSDIIRIRLFI